MLARFLVLVNVMTGLIGKCDGSFVAATWNEIVHIFEHMRTKVRGIMLTAVSALG